MHGWWVQFKQIYGRMTDRQLAKMFGISVVDVEKLAKEFRLGKDREYFSGCKHKPWTAAEDAKLAELYPTTSNVVIAHELNRTVEAVRARAYGKKLRKGRERLEKMGRRNIAHRWGKEKPKVS